MGISKITLLLLFLALSLVMIAFQQLGNENQQYSAQTIKAHVYLNEQFLYERPYGKNVTITCDTLFKSYLIRYVNRNNEKAAIKLDYFIKNNHLGYLTKDQGGTIWEVIDSLKSTGGFAMMTNLNDSTVLALIVKNAIPSK